MKKYLSWILIILVSGCSSFGKSKNIVSFSALVESELDNFTVNIPASQLPNDGAVEISKGNFKIKDFSDNQRFNKISLPSDIAAKPLITGSEIYILCSNGILYSYDRQNLTQNWNMKLYDKKTADKAFGGGIAYSNNKLYVTNGGQELFVINANNGRKITVKKFPDAIAKAPIVKNGFIYLLTLNNQLFTLGQSNLVLIWDHAGLPEALTYGAKSSALLFTDNGEVFVSYSSGQIFLLSHENGSVIWQKDFSEEHNMPGLFPVNFVGEPVMDSGFVYLADSTGKLYKLEIRGGKEVWSKQISDIQTFNKVGNVILAVTNGRQVIAVDIESGKVGWSKDIIDFACFKKQERENRQIEEYNQHLLDRSLTPKKQVSPPKGRIARAFYDFKNKFISSDDKPQQPKRARNLYNRDQVKPINIIESIVANDLYQLFSSKGEVYYISPLDGKILDQRNIAKQLSYVLVSDEFILAGKNKILLMK